MVDACAKCFNVLRVKQHSQGKLPGEFNEEEYFTLILWAGVAQRQSGRPVIDRWSVQVLPPAPSRLLLILE